MFMLVIVHEDQWCWFPQVVLQITRWCPNVLAMAYQEISSWATYISRSQQMFTNLSETSPKLGAIYGPMIAPNSCWLKLPRSSQMRSDALSPTKVSTACELKYGSVVILLRRQGTWSRSDISVSKLVASTGRSFHRPHRESPVHRMTSVGRCLLVCRNGSKSQIDGVVH